MNKNVVQVPAIVLTGLREAWIYSRLVSNPFEAEVGLEEIFKALKIKRPQFDVKECIPTDCGGFWKLISLKDSDYGNFMAWFLSKMG